MSDFIAYLPKVQMTPQLLFQLISPHLSIFEVSYFLRTCKTFYQLRKQSILNFQDPVNKRFKKFRKYQKFIDDEDW
jgi:hypothetical protein